MMLRTHEIVYENSTHWVKSVKNGFEVYRNGLTHSVRCAQIGSKGDQGINRAIKEADKRDAR